MKRAFLVSIGFMLVLCCYAENWDEVQQSEDYYFGIGMAATQKEADKIALENLMTSIVVHVQSDFSMLEDETTQNGSVESYTKIRNCINTYSQGTFRSVNSLYRGKSPNIEVLKYIKRTEVEKAFGMRIEAAKNYVQIADNAIEKNKVDLALQYYYWAYAMVCSLQYPNNAKDDQGNILAYTLPIKIRDILDKIDVQFDRQDSTFVSLLFCYNGKPMSSVDFSYNDGQSENDGCKAQDGRGCIEMAKGYENAPVFHINIEYEYKSQSRGEPEINSILAVVPKKYFRESYHKVLRRKENMRNSKQLTQTKIANVVTSLNEEQMMVDEPLKPSISQQPEKQDTYIQAMNRIIDAIGEERYGTVKDLFDIDGLDMYNKIMNYGTHRLIGEQNITFFKGADGIVTARGMKMSFSFSGIKKVSFVEDLVFTFNKNGKISNVTFGLGKVAANDILCRNADWGDDVKETIMEFLENYKTAYCLKRHEYIRDIFADDAVIIVGKVIHKSRTTTNIGEHQITKYGRDIITHNKYNKTQYLENLRRCFDNPRNNYINIKFANNDIQSLDSYNNHKVFGIQINQMYNSTTYADEGYLFLMVDMTKPDQPQIKIRTWQPTQTPIEQLYSAGDFYR